MESIGRLAGGVAHDFNNLLTVINGYSGMLLGELPPGDRSRRSLEQILKAGEHAAELTQKLLAFSRKQLVKPTQLSLNLVVTEAEKMLDRVIGEDIDLVTRLSPDLGAGSRRPRTDAPGCDEPGGERTRRHAHWRPAHRRDEERRAARSAWVSPIQAPA